eukprot:CAMPEP_0117462346 /NCGR_PEP_ID=MMETSP0784-20121206/3003_1 /TAXON_ID=39447 /ORGANISM="" /LENGTH=146 /DNA_ID=CAMNT_0005256101 /DNA_START=178 /DNA_END=618 /DNA_ORIENTATION=-
MVQTQAYGDGVFRYVCNGDEWEWVGLNVELSIDDMIIGRHFLAARNTLAWQWHDGSSVEATIAGIIGVADLDPDNNAPWLLLTGVSQQGDGVLSNVTYIQRVDTVGGPPNVLGDCDESMTGEEGVVDVTSTFIFLVPTGGSNDERE